MQRARSFEKSQFSIVLITKAKLVANQIEFINEADPFGAEQRETYLPASEDERRNFTEIFCARLRILSKIL